MHRTVLIASMALILTRALNAAFDGPYAPDLWTFTTEAGGFIETHSADRLVLYGGDIALGVDTDTTVRAVTAGAWSFDWSYTCFDGEVGFDTAYLLVNFQPYFLSDACSAGTFTNTGNATMSVAAGDVIGFRVQTADGIFGHGVLTITNFSAPVPGPASTASLVPLFGLRRRSRYDGSDDQ